MTHLRISVLTLALIVACGGAAACGGADTTADPDPAAARPRTMTETCSEIFVRQRDCTDLFIPALVDARIKADKPAGITARAAAEGRDAIIAEANGEWAEDSKDEAIAATCDKVVDSVPPEQAPKLQEAGDACLAEASCDAFVACVLPMLEARFE